MSPSLSRTRCPISGRFFEFLTASIGCIVSKYEPCKYNTNLVRVKNKFKKLPVSSNNVFARNEHEKLK